MAGMQFELDCFQLVELMAERSEGAARVNELGGVKGIATKLGSDTKAGISNSVAEIEARKQEFGANYVPPVPPKSFIALAFDALQDKTLIILIIAALVSLLLGVTVEEQKNIAWIEGAAILAAVAIVVIMTAIQDWTKERQFRGLQDKLETDTKFSVTREKEILELPLAEIVVGDIAKFKYGNTLPVDGILVQGFDVKVDEAAMTGEGEVVKKSSEKDPMLYAGTQVKEGSGTMLVTAVGEHSKKGMILKLLTARESKGFFAKLRSKCRRGKEEEEEEPFEREPEANSVLQKKLNRLAIRIEYMGSAAAILCILVLILKYVIEEFAIDGRSWDSSRDFSELLHFVIIGITVLVVAVPEGLPLAVTIALAFSVRKMLRDNNLVRHLHACETMGNATTICSDKTGTLTTNRMTVVESYFAGTKYDITPPASDLPPLLREVLKQGIAVNSSYTSKLIVDEDDDTAGGEKTLLERLIQWLKPTSSEGLLGQGLAKQVGNVTECALLGFLVELGYNYEPIRDEYPEEVLKKVFTFNSKRKSMSTVINLPEGGVRVLTKGAPDIVLDRCTHILGENGYVETLSRVQGGALKATVVHGMASNALRTICIAYRDIPADVAADIDWTGDCEDTVVNSLTCAGIVGIQDPVRPEVPSCIRQCQEAGITVRMVTGDFPATAQAIAEKCGIITKGDRALLLEGSEFNKRVRDSEGKISQDKLDRVWPRLRVLARSSPTDKYTLVNGIILSKRKKNRQVVAVTGDGTNDAPALKRADVGFAMGIAGTDVAKEASDIILTDDNFASIVKAVKWGRNVYDSISKFIQFQLTVNVVAVTLAVISAFTIGDTPLRAVQLLWVNLIMDTLASLALATESPTDALLKRKPYGRTQSLISRNMWIFILGHSVFQLTIMFVLVYAGPELFDIDDGSFRELRADPTEHFTLIFNTFVFLQIFNEINARKIHAEYNVFTGIFRNYIFLGVVVGQVTVQALIVEFGSLVFSTSGLSADLWLWCVFLGSTSLLWGQFLILVVMPLINKIPMRKKEAVEVPDYETNARLLWVKSLQRVRTQIRVVHAFRAGLEGSHEIHLSRIPQLTATPRGSRYVPTLAGIETAV